MTSLLQGSPEKPQERPGRRCAECGAAMVPGRGGTLFCAPPCRTAWNNRQTVRGRVLTSLAIVARVTRNGTRGDIETGKQATHEHNMLIARWVAEDARAGRMPWPEYQRRRYAMGFDPL